MKIKILSLLVLFTVSLSAEKSVIFDLTNAVRKPAGCEVMGQSAYNYKFKENYRTADNNKFKKGDLVTIQRKYVIFWPKIECPRFDRSEIFREDGAKLFCTISKVVKEIDTYESSMLQAVGECREAKRKGNFKEYKDVEDYLNNHTD